MSNNKAIFSATLPKKNRTLLDVLTTKRLHTISRSYMESRGHHMAVFANDHLGIYINQYGVFDKEALICLSQFLSPIADKMNSGTALDIGAHVGNHSLVFSKWFKTLWRLSRCHLLSSF